MGASRSTSLGSFLSHSFNTKPPTVAVKPSQPSRTDTPQVDHRKVEEPLEGMFHKGYEAWITCEWENLPEYGATPEGNDGKTFACFIPSESGKASAPAFFHPSRLPDARLGWGAVCKIPFANDRTEPCLSSFLHHRLRSSQAFAIHFKNGITQDWIRLSFKVDGQQLAHSTLCKSGQTASKKGVRTGLDIEQSFQFADLQMTGACFPGRCFRVQEFRVTMRW